MADAGRILIIPRGTYSATYAYEMLDLVNYKGVQWIAKKDTIGIEPNEANSDCWYKMAGHIVADNLVTTADGYVLDAKQGKVLMDEINTRKTEIAVERARIDNLVALEESSEATDVEKEIADIKVKTDGTIAKTAGEAVREQIGQLYSEIEEVSSPTNNVFNILQTEQTTNGISVYTENNTFIFNGVANSSASFRWYFGGSLDSVNELDGEICTLSYEIESGTFENGAIYLSLSNSSDTMIKFGVVDVKTFRLDITKHTFLNVYIDNGAKLNNLVVNIQLEKGEEVSPIIRKKQIANDEFARRTIEQNEKEVLELKAVIENNDNEILNIILSNDYYMGLEVGGFDDNGNHYNVTYRIRSTKFIPFSVFHKATWNGAYQMRLFCYDKDFAFIGSTNDVSNGLFTKENVSFENVEYVKIMFASVPVATITLDAITDSDFKLFTVMAKNIEASIVEKNEIPISWEYDDREINQLLGNGFTFAIQTDTHFVRGLPSQYYTALKNLSRDKGFDFIANLGDIVRGYEYDSVEASYEEYKKAIVGFVDGVGCSTFMAIGNHDNSSMYAVETNNIDNAFLPSELYSLIIRPCLTKDNGVVIGSKTGLYYYKDFADIRVVVLNTSDLPYLSLGNGDIDVNTLMVSTEQVEWFRSSALNTDKPILVLSHAPFDTTSGTTVTNGNLIVNELKTFTDNGGVVVACVSGHTHNLGATVLNNVNHIVCANGSEICEIFSVDLESRTITTKQIGRNPAESRTFTY